MFVNSMFCFWFNIQNGIKINFYSKFINKKYDKNFIFLF
jgi:hypothetical protein